jgi:hypothetical protein
LMTSWRNAIFILDCPFQHMRRSTAGARWTHPSSSWTSSSVLIGLGVPRRGKHRRRRGGSYTSRSIWEYFSSALLSAPTSPCPIQRQSRATCTKEGLGWGI